MCADTIYAFKKQVSLNKYPGKLQSPQQQEPDNNAGTDLKKSF